MGAPIDEAQVRHIAKLSRFNFSADEIRVPPMLDSSMGA